MANLSIRAFDEAQRRKQYPERRGPTGIACMQRDILSAQKHLAEIAELLWQSGMDASYNKTQISTQGNSKALNDHLSLAGLKVLQLTGALGIDFVSLLKQQIEKEELSVL